ncbi:MAG: tetratricopeptide repeat protein [Acidobacteria bacterium]|nr:MAG: tetratricopeptide repeat protein [Acidobacteriota bacterium]
MAAEPAREARPESPSSRNAPSDHLSAEELYELVEDRLSRRKLKVVEAHLADCADCVETLAMVLRAERPASREEQEILAKVPRLSNDELLARLRPHIEASAPPSAGFEWKPLILTFVLAALILSGGSIVRTRYWLPAASRRAAVETLAALVERRQATGRIPLRYITEFERAGVVRSGFDTVNDDELQLVANLRAAVERAPETEALLVLGLLLLDDGQLDEAEELLTRARDQDTDSVSAVNGLAVIHYERARIDPDGGHAFHQRGLALLREAEALDPEDLSVLYNYGKFYQAMDMHYPAVRALRRYIDKDQASQWAEEAAYDLAKLTTLP